jgi:hypothetical protein
MSASASASPQPTPQTPPASQTPAPAQGTAATAAPADKQTPEGGQPEGKKPAQAAQQPEDELRALLENMAQRAAALGASDLGLQTRIESLALTASSDPGRMQKDGFRTSVAYALQDLEKATGQTLLAGGQLAVEMRDRATTMPGLKLTPMEDLLARTPEMGDRELVRDIRQIAGTIAGLGENQDTEASRRLVSALESRLRPEAAPAGDAGAHAQTRPEPASAPPTVARPTAAAPEPARRPAPQQDGQPPPQANATQPAAQGPKTVPPHRQPSAIMDIVRKMRAPIPTGAETVMPLPASPLAERISLFEERIARGKTDRLIMDADQSGVRAIEATEQFIRGPGRGVLDKLEAAASTEPGGMQAVMKGMQPGGRYANLRTEFDNAHQRDQTFRGAYEKMVDSVTRFGQDREAVSNNLTQRNLDPSQVDGRFQRAEETLGESLSKIPGKEPGKSALDEVAGKIAEILHAAVDRIKSIFRPGEEPQQVRPSPSMSP